MSSTLQCRRLDTRRLSQCCGLWLVWKAHNKMVFHGLHLSTRDVARPIAEHVELWSFRAQSRLDVETF
ncbi:hypothetical protein HU200_028076 [Digitaria exilis]|uniref:Uncharacterized protein n=1 Tax=Digitaria exilis TaxID=1010633 RepID=A0A835C4J0_9POAL|nr:hypothetical protein HU200_028076 [Digitaria exilis]